MPDDVKVREIFEITFDGQKQFLTARMQGDGMFLDIDDQRNPQTQMQIGVLLNAAATAALVNFILKNSRVPIPVAFTPGDPRLDDLLTKHMEAKALLEKQNADAIQNFVKGKNSDIAPGIHLNGIHLTTTQCECGEGPKGHYSCKLRGEKYYDDPIAGKIRKGNFCAFCDEEILGATQVCKTSNPKYTGHFCQPK